MYMCPTLLMDCTIQHFWRPEVRERPSIKVFFFNCGHNFIHCLTFPPQTQQLTTHKKMGWLNVYTANSKLLSKLDHSPEYHGYTQIFYSNKLATTDFVYVCKDLYHKQLTTVTLLRTIQNLLVMKGSILCSTSMASMTRCPSIAESFL